jgi:hypothetical protein
VIDTPEPSVREEKGDEMEYNQSKSNDSNEPNQSYVTVFLREC